MKISNILAGLTCVGYAVASGRPPDVSICDYYTKALLTKDSETNQELLLTLLVNTVVIGNYTQPNYNYVPGILTPGTYDVRISVGKSVTSILRLPRASVSNVPPHDIEASGIHES
jgi:hypothetical protein